MACFLDLLLPLRERIYRLVLVTKRVFVRPFISTKYLTDRNRVDHYGVPALSLLRVSKQVYKEAMPIYLGENTYSIVQVDLLAAASSEFPRVLDNLKQIRKVEVIFDSRDYIYMAQFLAEELPAVTHVVEQLACGHDPENKSTAVNKLKAMHARFDLSGVCGRSTNPTASRNGSNCVHRQHIENIREYLWGRTLTFLRQHFTLSHLYVDLSRCICADGCCRLAEEVLDWGRLKVWVYGLPGEIQLRGASSCEKIAILRILDNQRSHRMLLPKDLCDADWAADATELNGYNQILREVHRMVGGG